MDRQREAKGLPRHIPLAFQRFIGVAEIAGAVDITIPAAFHVLTWLTLALGLAGCRIQCNRLPSSPARNVYGSSGARARAPRRVRRPRPYVPSRLSSRAAPS